MGSAHPVMGWAAQPVVPDHNHWGILEKAMNSKDHYERMANIYIKSFQEWSDSADESPSDSAKERRQAYAQEALADLAKVVDKADREGITLSVSMDTLPVTRPKLKEEIRLLQGRLEDAEAEVARVNRACAEIDADCDAHARRMERVAVIGGTLTFVLGIALGMMV